VLTFDIYLPCVELPTGVRVFLFELLKERQAQYLHEVDGDFMVRSALYFPKREMPCVQQIKGNLTG
jgi:hypothetical protein